MEQNPKSNAEEEKDTHLLNMGKLLLDTTTGSAVSHIRGHGEVNLQYGLENHGLGWLR